MGGSMKYRFYQVDVFSDHIFGGNALAVFPDASGICETEMQSLATEMNLSETTFVFPPRDRAAVAMVRIFTPSRELPFAGHPTLGTAYVLATLGRVTNRSWILEEQIGPVRIRIEDNPSAADVIWMEQPLPSFGEAIQKRDTLASGLGLISSDLLDIPIRIGSAGVPFLFVACTSQEAVDRARIIDLRLSGFQSPEPQGAFIFSPSALDGELCVYSRMLGFERLGILEDPATGGASGPLGAFVVQEGISQVSELVRIVSRQGVRMGRPSNVLIELTYERDRLRKVEVGGQVVPVLDGTVALPNSGRDPRSPSH